jgi:hypothetical protein
LHVGHDDAFLAVPRFLSAGISGLDLYAWDDGTQQYRFVATSQLQFGQTSWLAPMTPPTVNVTTPGTPLRWLLYACTYNEVVSLSIGVVDGSSIGPDDPYIPRSLTGPAPAPLVWYGTSIL